MSYGSTVEGWFRKSMEAEGYIVRRATDEENMKKHWDFMCFKYPENGTQTRTRVEVKAGKKIMGVIRYDKVPVEWVNVDGEIGWVRGEADWIAFEDGDNFLAVNRLDLQSHVATVDWSKSTKSVSAYQEPELYKVYDRSWCIRERTGLHNQDLVCLVPREQLLKLRHKFVKIGK
jgi:hypothetical protein